jgi:hypothetical protein
MHSLAFSLKLLLSANFSARETGRFFVDPDQFGEDKSLIISDDKSPISSVMTKTRSIRG